MNQTNLINRLGWDNLIVLDACRYDLFGKYRRKYLDGVTHKAISPASNTPGWMKLTWTDFYDLTYFSGNPYINSHGVPLGKYMPKDHFKRIIDVWNKGWSDELGTVPPENMNKAVINQKQKGRCVIHYVQPHRPYIGLSGIRRSGMILRNKMLDQPLPKPIPIGRTPKEKVKEAYILTLKLVLKYVSELIPYLHGKTVITADHGELLGELDEWGRHPPAIDHPVLREVPWFIVNEGS